MTTPTPHSALGDQEGLPVDPTAAPLRVDTDTNSGGVSRRERAPQHWQASSTSAVTFDTFLGKFFRECSDLVWHV